MRENYCHSEQNSKFELLPDCPPTTRNLEINGVSDASQRYLDSPPNRPIRIEKNNMNRLVHDGTDAK